MSHVCVVPAAQTPAPEQADHAPRLPSALQVRVSVPRLQFPHACVSEEPPHEQTPPLQLEPLMQA